AGLEVVRADRLEHGVGKARARVRHIHAVDLRGVEQPFDMRVEPEAGRSFRRLVTAGAFEDRAAVVDDVRRDVDLGVGPIHQRAVHPDLPRARETHDSILTYLLNLDGRDGAWAN